eukprot:3247049-Rhodomonas_salina.1
MVLQEVLCQLLRARTHHSPGHELPVGVADEGGPDGANVWKFVWRTVTYPLCDGLGRGCAKLSHNAILTLGAWPLDAAFFYFVIRADAKKAAYLRPDVCDVSGPEKLTLLAKHFSA